VLRGREALSAPFAFVVEFRRVDSESVSLRELLAAEAQITVRRSDGAERIVHGFVEVAELGGTGRLGPWYRLHVVPKLALLGHGRDSRIFQGKSVPEIVKDVLDEGKVAFRASLQGSYPRRDYCVQYQESDLAFVERLLAEEGIFYFFEFADGKHTVVLGDVPDAFTDVDGDPQIPYRPPAEDGGESRVEHVARAVRAGGVRPGRTIRRDFDCLHPELEVTGSASADGDGAEVYDWRLGTGDLASAKRLARTRLEEVRSDAVEVDAEGVCVRVLPGRRLELVEHPEAVLNQKYEIVRVEHEVRQEKGAGTADAIAHHYRCRFGAWPAGTPVRAGERPRAIVPGTQTATVVGPGGEEIHVDEHGRIKIQFHWDRDGKRDDRASCWVRAAQPWAGAGPATSRVPRIGQEVVVRFLEGDPDRPLVVGAVYDGGNPPPIGLPGDRTQSTVRSDSSPGGGGSNELKFEDRAGSEQIFRHAQKDENVVVENDADASVGRDATLDVEKDRTVHVGRDQQLEVTRHDAGEVMRNQTLGVGAARGTVVGGAHEETVVGSQSVSVAASQNVQVGMAAALTVGAAAALTVGGAYAVTVGAAFNTAVGGARALQVGGDEVLVGGGASGESVSGAFDRRIGGDEKVSVDAGVSLSVGSDFTGKVAGKEGAEAKGDAALVAKKVRLQAEDELVLAVGGKLLLSLKKSGDVAIAASAFSVKADGDLKLKGGQIKMVAGEGAASKMVEVKALEKVRKSRGTATVALQDSNGKALSSIRFRAELPDGTVTEGVTDASGNAAIPSSKEGDVKITFPDLEDDSWRTG
jgi:type VI secretion system secreted protein VgrG